METLGTVLIVTRGGPQWTAAAAVLCDEYDYRVLSARSPADAATALSDAHIDIVLAEHGASGEGLEFLAGLRISHPDIIRVLALEAQTVLTKQAISPAAIYQFVRKPLDAKQIGLVIERGLASRELARRHRMLSREFKVSADSLERHARQGVPMHAESQRFEKLIYVSEKMSDLCDLARKAARTELPILIQGETGTGKELLARAIHSNSTRHASPLMLQNCGGMSNELLQSELFAHKRGPYTGAFSESRPVPRG